METRIALVSIIVENADAAGALNAILHAYSGYMIGRMGIPYREQNLYLISLVLHAPQDQVSALSGKLGNLQGVHVKTIFSSVRPNETH